MMEKLTGIDFSRQGFLKALIRGITPAIVYLATMNKEEDQQVFDACFDYVIDELNFLRKKYWESRQEWLRLTLPQEGQGEK